MAGATLSREATKVQVSNSPHNPPSSLPTNKMAVYVFFWGDQCLKVGKAGPKSQPRYTSQHYNPGSNGSNLAKSVLKYGREMGLSGVGEDNVGEWIRQNTSRVNILIDVAAGERILGLLESFLQCRFQPRFEGFKSDK